MRIEVEDFIHKFKDYNKIMTEEFILKILANHGKRLSAIKTKIYNAMGIPPWKLDILKMTIAVTKKAKLARLTFNKEKTVGDIIWLVQIYNNQRNFPYVPAKALARKNVIENILKRLQNINKPLRYQVRLGELYLAVMVKHHYPHD